MTVTRFELEAARLVMTNRWAALATLGEDGPSASMVAYASQRDLSSLFLFLSGLSEHTHNLLKEPEISLVISEPDIEGGDPQTLTRVSLKGRAEMIDRADPGFEDLWGMYVTRLPDAAPLITLGDFSLIRVVVREARYVGGFAQVRTIGVDRLAAAALEF